MADGGTSSEAVALRSLHDLITTVHALQDLEEVLQAAAQGVVDVLGYQVAVVNCLDEHGFVEAVAVAGDIQDVLALKGRRMPVQEFLDEFELAEEWGSLRFVPHTNLPPDAVSSWVPDVEPLDVPDAWHPLDSLYAPLHGPTGELLGVLNVDLPVDRRRPGPLSRQVLEMYAVQAGLAIHHAQERDRLRERVRLAGATGTIVETASRGLELREILQDSFQPLLDGFRSDRLQIRVFDSEDDGFGDPGLSGPGATYPENLMERLKPRLGELSAEIGSDAGARLLEIGERTARRCWPWDRTCVIGGLGDTSADLLDEDELRLARGLLASVEATSLVIVPLGSGHECLGYVTLIRAQPVPWSAAEDEAARMVGREIGRAVDRARLYQRERRLVAELRELDLYKDEMTATITHELKSPLTTIVGHVELLRDEQVSPVSVEAIARNAQRLQELVDDMLLMRRVRDEQRSLTAVPVDLGTVTREVCDQLGLQATGRTLRLETPADGSAVTVLGDRDEISRMVVNVVGNALKYTPEGGRVDVRVEQGGVWGGLTCADTGIGIAAEDLGSLFDEFDRSSNPAVHDLPGTGLGLAIVRRIVERHGGTITVESELGRGSTFQVWLPCAATNAAANAGTRPGTRPATAVVTQVRSGVVATHASG